MNRLSRRATVKLEHPDTARKDTPVLTNGDAADAPEHPLGNRQGSGKVGLGKNDKEFLTAVSSGAIRGPDTVLDGLAGTFKNLVAVLVPELAVDGLEIVKIDHDQRKCAAGATGSQNLILDGLENGRVVKQAGQAINRCQRLDPGGELFGKGPLAAKAAHADRKQTERAERADDEYGHRFEKPDGRQPADNPDRLIESLPDDQGHENQGDGGKQQVTTT